MFTDSTLLIIGNGFDLQCGLKSSYNDFFEWLRKDQALANNNLWAIHFLSTPPKGYGWIDIEESLRKVLCSKSHEYSTLELWEKDAEQFFYQMKNGEGFGFSRDQEVAIYIARKMIAQQKKVTKPDNLPKFDIYWYLEELNAFESLFSEFIKNEVLSNGNYL